MDNMMSMSDFVSKYSFIEGIAYMLSNQNPYEAKRMLEYCSYEEIYKAYTVRRLVNQY